jgi:nitrite reductase (NADH) small subunit
MTEPVVRQVNAEVLLVEVDELRVLIEASCPHRKGRLRFGHINPRTRRITCPLHHSAFELATGRQVSGPPCRPLRVSVLEPTEAEPVGGSR